MSLLTRIKAAINYGVGFSYENGKNTAPDYQLAVEHYTKAAEQGHTGAQNNLGACYLCGRGVAPDVAKAVEWFSKSAEQGNPDAQKLLQKLSAMLSIFD